MSDQKTALVTGANKGIGYEIARQLHAKGLRVFLTARNAAAGRKAATSLHENVQFLPMDVSDDASIENAARTFGELNGSLDVLVNNAAIYPDENFDILTISREQLERTFQTNTFGPLRVTQAFLPLLKKSSEARIVNISSGYGEMDGLSQKVPSYCLSKLTLNGLTIMLDQALRSEGVAVYVMCPGLGSHRYGGCERLPLETGTFCKENPAFTRNLAKVKSSFNPIAAFYQDSMQAWIYANSQAAETRDALGPEAWDRYQEMRKYSETNILRSGLSPEENFKKWLAGKK